MVCPRRAFETIGGYDEAMRGWGGDENGPLPVLKYTMAGGGWLPPG